MLMNKNEYGFINQRDLPRGAYHEEELPLLAEVTWAKTSNYNDEAKNHCGAVFVTNLALYYSVLGYDNLLSDNLKDTFSTIHTIVGNGPKVFLARNASSFFSQRGYDLKHSTFRSHEKIKEAIVEGFPMGLLVSAGLFQWHWVMVVGFRHYASEELYVRIVTGWDSKKTKYYKLGSGSSWWSATSYRLNL